MDINPSDSSSTLEPEPNLETLAPKIPSNRNMGRRRKRTEVVVTLRKVKNKNSEIPVSHAIPLPSTDTNIFDALQAKDFKDANQLTLLTNACNWIRKGTPELQLRGIQSLVRFLSESAKEVRIWNISIVIQANVLPECIKFLRDGSPDLQNATLWLMMNAAAGNESQTDYLILIGAIQPIILLLSSSDPTTTDLAVWVIANCMADDSKQCNRLLHMRVIPALVDIIRRFINNIQIMKILAFALHHATRYEKSVYGARITLFEISQCLTAIHSLLLIADVDVQEYALKALLNISRGSMDQVDMVVKVGFAPILIHLLDCQEIKILILCAKNIGNMAYGSDAQTDVLLDFGIVPTLIKLIDASNKELVYEAAWTLSNIAAGTNNQAKEVLAADGLRKVVDLLESDEQTMEIKKECLWVIANLASNDGIKKSPKSFVKAILNTKAIEILTVHLTVKDNGVIEVALKALENILKLGTKKYVVNSVVYKMENSGALEEIQNLSYHVHSRISKLAISILDHNAIYNYEFGSEKNTVREVNSVEEYMANKKWDDNNW